jgi:hypothetical protein
MSRMAVFLIFNLICRSTTPSCIIAFTDYIIHEPLQLIVDGFLNFPSVFPNRVGIERQAVFENGAGLTKYCFEMS